MRTKSNILYAFVAGAFVLSSTHAQELLKISLPEANAFLDVSFKHKDAFIDDIRMDEIKVEDGEDARVVAMENMQEFPLYIAILLDASGSQFPHSAELHQFYGEMIAAISLRPSDRASLVAFNQKINIIQDSTRDKTLLADGFSKIRFWGGTRLYDAIDAVSGALDDRKSSCKALFIISDGEDKNSSLGIKETYQKAEENNVRVYMFARKIKQKTGIFAYPEVGEYRKHAKYIKRTGGRILEYSNVESAKDRISELMDELKHLKRIGIFVDLPGKPSSDLKISVSRKGVKATYPSTLQYID